MEHLREFKGNGISFLQNLQRNLFHMVSNASINYF